MTTTRRLELTDDLLRAYSRRGNFHSEPADAEQLGLPGLVAQGMQVAGPAYGLVLDAWGTDFLERGTVDVRFVAMVIADATVEASVEVEGDAATFEVLDCGSGRTAVAGTANRAGEGS